jgi:membrane protease subunit HflK
MPWDPNEGAGRGEGGGGGFEAPELRLPSNLLGIVTLVLLGVGALFALRSSFFTVGPDETAVVLRLGRFSHTAPPGFHLRLPFGVDAVKVFATTRVLKEEFGFRTVRADARTEYSRASFNAESLMLTGDLNVADVEWIVQYRIQDPARLWFRLDEPRQTVRDVAEAVMRQVIGNRTVDTVLTSGRAQIEEEAKRSMSEVLKAYDAGIAVVAVQLQNVTPPEPVQPSFNDVNRAEQDREKLENEALARRNRDIPSARGEAQRRIDQSLGYQQTRVNRAHGEVARFRDLLREYRKAPEVTRRRLYLETTARVLPEVEELIIVDASLGARALPHLDLGVAGGATAASPAPPAAGKGGGR